MSLHSVKLNDVSFRALQDVKRLYGCSSSDAISRLAAYQKAIEEQSQPYLDRIKELYIKRWMDVNDISFEHFEDPEDYFKLLPNAPSVSVPSSSRMDSVWWSSPVEKRMFFADLSKRGITVDDLGTEEYERLKIESHERYLSRVSAIKKERARINSIQDYCVLLFLLIVLVIFPSELPNLRMTGTMFGSLLLRALVVFETFMFLSTILCLV